MKEHLEVSINQSKFLYRFLGTRSLEELLPLYVSAVSNNKTLFKVLPTELISSVIESLRKLQLEMSVFRMLEKSDFDENKILRSLRNLNGNELLSNYVSSVTENSISYFDLAGVQVVLEQKATLIA